MKSVLFVLAMSSAVVFAPSALASNFTLNDWCVNVNGDTSTCNDSSSGTALTGNAAVNISGFDTTTLINGTNNLGSITVTLGAGTGQYVGFYIDYDILYNLYLSNSDNVSTTGDPVPGQSYQIGDPTDFNGTTTPSGYTLFDAFATGTSLSDLSTLGTPGEDPQCCDVGLAMLFSGIDVGPTGTATVTFNVSSAQPGSPFYITQASNSGDGGSIFASGDVALMDLDGSETPEPSTFLLGAAALIAAALAARGRRAGVPAV